MTIGMWFLRRLSRWVVGAFLLTCFLVVLVEGVERAPVVEHGFGGWLVLLWRRLCVVLRDVLPLCFVFGASGLALQMRRQERRALRVCGVSSHRLYGLALLGFLAWSVLFSAAVDRGVLELSDKKHSGLFWDAEGIHWVFVDEDGRLDFHTVHLQNDRLSLQDGVLSQSERSDWLLWPSPREASMTQLAQHPHERAEAWLLWRRMGVVFPGLLGVFTFALCLSPSVSWGWAVSWSAGTALVLQWMGSLVVRNAWFSP